MQSLPVSNPVSWLVHRNIEKHFSWRTDLQMLSNQKEVWPAQHLRRVAGRLHLCFGTVCLRADPWILALRSLRRLCNGLEGVCRGRNGCLIWREFEFGLTTAAILEVSDPWKNSFSSVESHVLKRKIMKNYSAIYVISVLPPFGWKVGSHKQWVRRVFLESPFLVAGPWRCEVWEKGSLTLVPCHQHERFEPAGSASPGTVPDWGLTAHLPNPNLLPPGHLHTHWKSPGKHLPIWQQGSVQLSDHWVSLPSSMVSWPLSGSPDLGSLIKGSQFFPFGYFQV